ncbi:MAG TPA: hypothetical protein VMT88_09255 [Actinomycetes bacterium]|nr:hypothetical protein [Actinomycetes bacterium]
MLRKSPRGIGTQALVLAIVGLSSAASLPMTAQAQVNVNVSGRIIAGDRINQSDIRVRLCDDSNNCSKANPSGSGDFALDVPAGRYTVTIFSVHTSPPGQWFWSMWTTTEITADTHWRLTLPEPVNVNVTAKNSSRKPIANAHVYSDEYAAPGSGEADDAQLTTKLPSFEVSSAPISTFTDRNGVAKSRVFPEQSIELFVKHSYGDVSDARLPLNTPDRVSVNARRDVDVTAKALPLETLGVRVFDFVGHPIGANMRVSSPWGDVWAPGDVGGYNSVRFPRGAVQVDVSGFNPATSTAPRGIASQPLFLGTDRLVDLTLPKPVSVVAQVIDSDNGLPAEGVRVTAGGYYYGPDLSSEDAQANDAVLSPGLPAASMYNARPQGETHIDGTVRFKLFADDSLPLAVTESEPGAFRKAPPIVANAGNDATVQLALPKSVKLTVAATDAADTPIAGVDAELRITSEYGFPFVLDNNGAPTMKILPGLTRVRLGIPIASLPGNSGQVRVTSDVNVLADRTLHVSLPDAHQLKVRLVDENGHPVEGGFVSATGRPDIQIGGHLVQGFEVAQGQTNAKGRTTLTFVDTGSINVNAYVNGLSYPADTLDGSHDQTIVLTAVG